MSIESANERDALAATVHDLAGKFPHLPESVITDHVNEAYCRLGNAVVRNYVPVLVQRQARITLSKLTPDSAGPAWSVRSISA